MFITCATLHYGRTCSYLDYEDTTLNHGISLIFTVFQPYSRHAVVQFVEALHYKRVRFPMMSLQFFIAIILSAALWLWS